MFSPRFLCFLRLRREALEMIFYISFYNFSARYLWTLVLGAKRRKQGSKDFGHPFSARGAEEYLGQSLDSFTFLLFFWVLVIAFG